jgi:hypothetical protein
MLRMLTLSAREPFLWNAAFHGIQDHFMLLNRRHSADTFVVSDRFVFGRD